MRATLVSSRLMEIRCGLGNGSGGGLNAGWKPPTLSTKSGWSPNATSSPSSPAMVIVRTRES